MRRDLIKDVQIKEPPLEELTRKYSTFSTIKRSCLGGCGCLLFLFIILVVILKIVIGVGPQDLKSVPENFPKEIPVYDKDNIESITFISGKYKNRAIEIAAIFPKIILSPLLLALDKNTHNTPTNFNTNRAYTVGQVWNIINTPISDQRDVVTVKWGTLDAELDFVLSYYKIELNKNNFTINADSETEKIKQFSFSRGDTSGSFYIEAGEDTDISYAMLTVNYFATTTNK